MPPYREERALYASRGWSERLRWMVRAHKENDLSLRSLRAEPGWARLGNRPKKSANTNQATRTNLINMSTHWQTN
jgi:hypothetical protein